MIAVSEIIDALSRGIGATLEVTFGAFLFGLVVAIPVALARMAPFAPVRYLATAYIEIFRGVPPVAWLFVIFFGLADVGIQIPALPAAIVGLGLIAGAYLAEIYRAAIQSVPRGQWEAARAIGLLPVRILASVIVPQAILVVIPPSATYLVGLLKDSALASTVGAEEVTFRAYILSQKTFAGLEIFTVTALIYIVLSLPLAVLSRWLGYRLSQHLAR